MSSEVKKLRYAMVGGGHGAFIGAVHRQAMALDGQFELVAGALSSSPERARASGASLGLAADRNHGSWQDLLADELRKLGSSENQARAAVFAFQDEVQQELSRLHLAENG